ncbi:hypothetical protein ACFL1I_07935 [Candidatus Omnitrophota bacterium]
MRLKGAICLILVISVVLAGGMSLFNTQISWAEEEPAYNLVKQELQIKVKPRTIALPGNQVAIVPIRYARVRSSELRTLNQGYNATHIGKVYQIREVGNREPEKVEIPNTYNLIFSIDPQKTSIQQILSDYRALGVILSIQEK